MAPGAIAQHTRSETEPSASNFLDFFSNTLVLRQTAPYLPISTLLSLAATSKRFRALVQQTPDAFRHLDLSHVKAAQFEIDGIDHGGEVWRNAQLDENVTEDDFYSGPLRGIFQNLRRRNLLQDVQTLVLDGLSVTAELVNDILVDPSLNIRILSIRETKNLNERKLMQSLRYACRPSRAEGTPRLKGLYVFGRRDAPVFPTTSASSAVSTPSSRSTDTSVGWQPMSALALKEAMGGGGDDWYHKKGRIINKPVADGWAEILLDCRGKIAFDAVLCTGPQHQNSPAYGKVPVAGSGSGKPWSVATFALSGCATCGCAPDGLTTHGHTPNEQLPLLAPVPLHSSNVKVAMRHQRGDTSESSESSQFVPRCWECIRERYCFSCDQWWCESCYHIPTREELLASQHVHIVDAGNGLADHEAAVEPLKVKVRMGYCDVCNLRGLKNKTGAKRIPN